LRATALAGFGLALNFFVVGSTHQPDLASNTLLPLPLISETARTDPADFSAAELQQLQRRFGVHGPQTPLAQLFTAGLDHWIPLRSHTLTRLEALMPLIKQEAKKRNLNPMLLTAILYDEMQHAKPGEDSALAMQSGLFQTHGVAQLGIEELIHQGLLPKQPSPSQMAWAQQELLNPERNVSILAGKMQRLIIALKGSTKANLNASTSYRDAHLMATLAYLHNGKLDYPIRILKYMQDPALHGLVYSSREPSPSSII
jgi:hypothetical protein